MTALKRQRRSLCFHDLCREAWDVIRTLREVRRIMQKPYMHFYVHYKKDYKITMQQLEYLAQYIKKLHEVTEKICAAKIESFV